MAINQWWPIVCQEVGRLVDFLAVHTCRSLFRLYPGHSRGASQADVDILHLERLLQAQDYVSLEYLACRLMAIPTENNEAIF